MKRLCLLGCLLLAGCNHDEQNAIENAKEFKSGGTFIGELPDGRKIYQFKVTRDPHYDHYIYVVGDTVSQNHTQEDSDDNTHLSNTTTVNQQVRRGKATHIGASVMIDGVPYYPLEKVEAEK